MTTAQQTGIELNQALLVEEARALIARWDLALADAWVKQPFNRVAIAKAFSAGFGRHQRGGNGLVSAAEAVVKAAALDVKVRQALAAGAVQAA